MLLEGFEILGKKKNKRFFSILNFSNLLDSPPSAMRAILQNSWLSEVFREQALNKVISCALKVRRATAKVTKKIIIKKF
jgi:hypothetical protein